MESLYILIPLSTVLVFVAIWIFFRASDSGQFDDLEGPALRILLDDDMPPPSSQSPSSAPADATSPAIAPAQALTAATLQRDAA